VVIPLKSSSKHMWGVTNVERSVGKIGTMHRSIPSCRLKTSSQIHQLLNLF
jgi:hypothetical protein